MDCEDISCNYKIIIICIVCSVVLVTVITVPLVLRKRGNGTTPDFPKIVLERCTRYTEDLWPELQDKNCPQIKDAFINAFISKDPCKSTERDYEELMRLTHQTIPCSKSVLWSKSKELAKRYTSTRPGLILVGDTLMGYLAENLTWCGDAGSSEINYEYCKESGKDCVNNTVFEFWKAASKRFARNSCGVVQAVLSGSHRDTFDKNSIFLSVEVPNLNPKSVTKLQVWLTYETGGNLRHRCSGVEMNDLKSIVSEKRIAFICKEITENELFLKKK